MMEETEQSFETVVQKHQAGDLAGAIAGYRALLQQHPENAELHRLLGVALLQTGSVDEAIGHIQEAIAMAPGNAAARCNLGTALRATGRIEEAGKAFEDALSINPDLAEAHNNLGALAVQTGDRSEAERHYRKAAALAPQSAPAQANLAALLLQNGAASDALHHAELAVRADPGLIPARKLHACALLEAGQWEAAQAAFEKLLSEGVADAETHHRYGSMLEEQGRWSEALTAQRRALEQAPGHGAALSDALFLARRLCQWDISDDLAKRFAEGIAREIPGLKPFTQLSDWSSPEQQRACARLWARRIPQPVAESPTISSTGPLTIGYLSSGFRRHPTALLTAELFENHSRQDFRWIGYATGPDDGSELRSRIAGAFDRFRDVAGMAHDRLATQIREDGVDILIDLRGYGGGAVTEVFARRPAPVQVNWLAYPGTMGAAFMDYIVVDPHVAPSAVARYFDEAPVFLPYCYQPTDTSRVRDPAAPPRSACKLPENAFVFCSFNNSYKISRRIFARWMAILEAVPDSVLWLMAGPDPKVADNLRAHAGNAGIDPARLVFMTKQPHDEYLARYRLCGLFLDTLPYNAHTTASDALWAGCPVLTCRGDTFAGRVASSLCTNAGLEALVVDSLDEYERLAIELGNDPERVGELSSKLAAGRSSWPLFQTAQRARELEAAYREMARRARAGKPPGPITIEPGGNSQGAS